MLHVKVKIDILYEYSQLNQEPSFKAPEEPLIDCVIFTWSYYNRESFNFISLCT